MKQADVYWVTLPYSDLAGEKHRPVLILSNDQYNRESDDRLVCAVTSNPAPKPYSLKLAQTDFSEGTLPLASRVRADKLFSIHRSLFSRKMGVVSEAFFLKVGAEISKLIKPAHAKG